MRQESNHRMNSGEKESPRISNSRAMGVIILIALLFVFQVTAFVVQRVRIASLERERPAEMAKGELFPFDPNEISLDSLQLLGFSRRQAQTILNYRNKGGKFRHRQDFAKMYVVDSAKYHTLASYIMLPDRPSSPAVHLAEKSVVSGPKSAERESLAEKSVVSRPKSAERESLTEEDGVVRKEKRSRYMCNLNTADSAALVRLYGIGGYYARKILKYREQLGGSFVSPRQLMEIEGFTQERYSRIENNVFVNEGDVKGFSILKADRKSLERHPYIGPYAARGIVTYLRIKGLSAIDTARAESAASSKYAGDERTLLQELVKERILTPENARKLEEYLLYL